MPDPHPRPRFDPRSPVQPGKSPAPYFLLAIVGAISVWGLHQCTVEDSSFQRGERAPAGVNERTLDRARGDVRTVFSDNDYPAEAQRNGEEGTVQARLAIDASGHVTRCTIVRSSGHASLDAATCRILTERARFAPAQDSSGNRRADTYVTPPVSWRLAE